MNIKIDDSMNIKRNLSMLTDFYQLTMGNGYLKKGMRDRTAYFDMFFRKIPDDGGYVIIAGLEQLIEYINNLSFSEEDIKFLRERGIFSEDFLEYLRDFKFQCDIWAIPEGTVVFPNEPIITVRGPLPQAQLIETMLLLTINHQSLIATKASRVVRASQGRWVLEFGSRRAQGYDGALFGARAAYIGGCFGTACTMVEELYGIPSVGTMAHSWIQSFHSEYEAFKAYAEVYPTSSVLLVDTYNTLKSGVPNAIRVAKEILETKGNRLKGIRLDSGDIAYLSKAARKMLDEAGMKDCKITASNSLDEYLISDLLLQGAEIDIFGVGENLITSKSNPVFGGVYKLVAIENGNKLESKIKLSENPEKVTNPGFKKLYRFYHKETNKAVGDLLTLRDEVLDESKPYILFDPVHTWKKTVLTDYYVKELQVKIFDKGESVYLSPSIQEIREYCKGQVETLWEESLRLKNPHNYYVDLSEKLWTLKYDLINKYSNEENHS
ncbi:nicotinate phosphoribosyltransferase [uncultured Clostridium sp.]|uniref:nicotinate phosphoribosyltransferase n=1 Tax=uncultured Clostridium sp. TaxID=59620 RepID=UPI0032170E79